MNPRLSLWVDRCWLPDATALLCEGSVWLFKSSACDSQLVSRCHRETSSQIHTPESRSFHTIPHTCPVPGCLSTGNRNGFNSGAQGLTPEAYDACVRSGRPSSRPAGDAPPSASSRRRPRPPGQYSRRWCA